MENNMELVLTNETLVTVVGVALFTAMAVSNFIKPALSTRKEEAYYGLAINVAALVVAEIFAILGLIIASIALDSAATLAMALARGFFAAFLATAGYEGYANIRLFVAARKQE
jgi:hypothetical protein